MERFRQKTMQSIRVNSLIDELQGKEGTPQSKVSMSEDMDRDDYELFETEENAHHGRHPKVVKA
jgi:hypothetical protein